MSAIRKLRANRYQYDFILFGHRIRTNFHQESHAEDFQKRLHAVFPSHNISIETAILLYLKNETDKRKAKQTRIMERYWFYELKTFLRTQCQIEPTALIFEITRFHLEKFQSHLIENGTTRGRALTPATVNRYFSTIKNFTARLYEWGFVVKDPGEHIRKLPEKLNRRQPWAKTEIAKFIESSFLWPDDLALFRFLLGTGVRLGSACAIREQDVHLVERAIVIYQSKGRGEQTAYSIPISDSIFPIIAARISGDPDGYIFRDELGRCLVPATVSKRFTRAFAAVGLSHLKLHGLRHTFASELSAAGASTESIRRLCGHRSGKTTERYLHLDLEHLRRWLK